MLTEETLRMGMATKSFGKKIYTFETIDSTNNCARALAGCWAAEGTVVISEHQTLGKGRHGRAWQANPLENLTFSLILRPTVPPDYLNLLPLYVAVAVAKAVEDSTGLRVECKWPNDLLVNGRKFAGILLEGAVKENALEYVVVGIGLNVNQLKFDGDLEHRATSLRRECGREIDRPGLFRSILASLELYYHEIISSNAQAILPSWLSHCTMLNKQISVSTNGSIISGVVKGLSREGGLILQSDGSEQTLYAGDVTIVGT